MKGGFCCCIVALHIFREWHKLQTGAMAESLFLISRPVRSEAMLHGYRTSPVCLFYAIATVFQLYHGGDIMYEMRRRKPEPTLLSTHIDMV